MKPASTSTALIFVYFTFAVHQVTAAELNVLKNASVEDGTDSPAHWKKGRDISEVEYSWVRTEGSHGDACLCIRKTAKRYFPIASWSQTIERDPASSGLKVSAKVKAKDVTKAVLDVIFLDQQGKRIGHKWAKYIGEKEPGAPPVNHDWKTYSGSVAIPENTRKIVVSLQDYGYGTVWFDEISASFTKD